ncbi:MAG: hypothetical protein JWO32_1371 [Bacteroidetes bacterium]|nr:hypothetical protein [Bacteroidota bacterium]
MAALRTVIFKFMYGMGIGKLLLQKNRNCLRVPVLVFHKITAEKDPVWPGIDPELFEKIIILLKQHYKILPLNALLTTSVSELKHACFITFDDGYKDYLQYAYPIMKKHEVHSSLFVLPHDLSNMGHIWTSTIIFFVKHYSFKEINNFFLAQSIKIEMHENMSAFAVNMCITKYFCELTQVQRIPIIKELQDKFLKDNIVIENELLSFNELKTLDTNFVSVESHSLTHPSFKLESKEEFVEYELKHSKELIENELKTAVNCFAFPFSKWNNLSLSLVHKYYNICFTRINDMVDLKKLNNTKEYLYDLPRFNVHHDSREEVFFLINGFHSKINEIFRK